MRGNLIITDLQVGNRHYGKITKVKKDDLHNNEFDVNTYLHELDTKKPKKMYY